MKKIISLLFVIVLSLNVKAQATLTEAVDFTAVDCYGQDTIHLFEILDRGQYVLIDFYFYSCDPCFDACPKMVEAYKALGCNKHDVFFIEISPSDSNDQCQWWAEKFGVEYPTISREAGGDKIDDAYGIRKYPTLVLIAPDRSIALSDIDCFDIIDNGYQVIVDALAPFGIEEHSCDEEPEVPVVTPEKPEATAIATSDTSILVVWNAVENAVTYNIYQGTELVADSIDDIQYTVTGLTADTEYCFSVTAVSTTAESEKSDETCDKTFSGENVEELLLNNFKIYPNPASSEINIISEMKEADVKIYDMTGRCVKNVRISDDNTRINISDIEKGLYLVNINGNIEKLTIDN